MSAAASDCQTEEELEDLGEDELSVDNFISNIEKRPIKKKTSSKPPTSPKSPYVTSANLHPKRASVWRSVKGTGVLNCENSTMRVPRDFCVTSLKSGLDIDGNQAKHSTSASVPEYLKEAFGMRKPKYSRSSSNGYIPGTPDFKEKEDMYDEIIELKKCLQSQKCENDIMKTKLRRLEEENNKKEKQIEQLLDPTKGSEYTRGLVDKKNDSSSVLYGLKQKILKLEQHCKEKDSALNKLQSDLKTTNIEELKIMMETYYEEVQRLRVLLATAESTEKSITAETRAHLKQQKALNVTILKLSKSIKCLEEENKALRKEVRRAMESPSSTSRGYADWSKQRLVRRIVELEKKIRDSASDDGAKPTAANAGVANADRTTQELPVEDIEKDTLRECARLRGLVRRLREERADLQEVLADRSAEIKRQSAEKAKAIKDIERAKTIEHNQATRHFKQEIEKLTEKIKMLESKLEEEKKCSKKSGGRSERPQNSAELSREDAEANSACVQKVEMEEKAAKTIQRHWHQYKHRGSAALPECRYDASEEDVILIQSAIRGHLARQKSLKIKNLYEHKQSNFHKSPETEVIGGVDRRHSGVGDRDECVVLLQSVFRGHLARCRFKTAVSLPEVTDSLISASSSECSAPVSTLTWNSKSVLNCKSEAGAVTVVAVSDEEIEEDIPDDCPEEKQGDMDSGIYRSSLRRNQTSGQLDGCPATESAKAEDSDDSDDIIVSPSRPPRRGDSYF